MATTTAERLYTPEEYLALERVSETKNEFCRGQISPMTGASREHNLIAGNIYANIHFQLRRRLAEVYQNDMRVLINETGLYTYPDVVVADSPVFKDAEVDTLLNPKIIFEVLSKSTEQRDRGDKFEQYCSIDSLTDYLLVSQNRCRIENFTRQPDGFWLYRAYTDQSDTIQLDSIDCELLLEDVYDKVKLIEESDAGLQQNGNQS